MKRMLTLFILLFLIVPASGQQKKTIKKKKDNIIQTINEINAQLKYYETLSPFSDDGYQLIDSVRNNITTLLLTILNDKQIIKYPVEKLIYQNDLFISKSNDNRIFFFSINEKTGGSYWPSTTIIHYRLSDGMVKAEIFGDDASEALTTSVYGEVHLLDSLDQKYFVIGGVQTCNTCYASVAITIMLDTNSYHTDLLAQYDGRSDDLKLFEYDPIEKIFSYEYDAADNEDTLYGGNNNNAGLQHKYRSKLKYINGAFLEIEKCEVWEKKE